MRIPTQEEQEELEAEVAEIKNSIIQKRDARTKITSNNTQRFIVGELGSIFWYFALAEILLLAKMLQHNQVSIVIISVGFCASLIILFVFGISIIKLRQRQEEGAVNTKLIIPVLILSFVPYVFGLYLILVIGVFNLFNQFSFIYLPQAIIYAYLGYLLMKKVKIIQELGMRISENK